MGSLGYYLLLAAFVVAAYAAGSPWLAPGAARRRWSSRVGAFYMLAAIMAAASAVIVHAFVVGDYSIKYVNESPIPLSRSSTS